MKYVVLETNRDFSVVLDESGRFINVSNNNYEVGQTVDNIVEYTPKRKFSFNTRLFAAITGSVAVFLSIALSLYFFNSANNLHEPFMSVYLTINPEVRLAVNKDGLVTQLSFLDADGAALLNGYSSEQESLLVALNRLILRAIDMGYLSDGDYIRIRVDSFDELLFCGICSEIAESLTRLLSESISVTVIIDIYAGSRKVSSLIFNTSDNSFFCVGSPINPYCARNPNDGRCKRHS